VVVQEALLRMWLVARDPSRVLEGSNAPIKFAMRVARNVALEEVRRYRHERLVGLDGLDNLPEGRVEVDPPDPALARAIKDCIESLPEQPRKALSGRVHDGGLPDREIAAALRMKINTFLQNIVRARRLLRECLDRRGVRLGEVLP
jgi:DNA-directed RNA polymerase specialized sigma24 family protein